MLARAAREMGLDLSSSRMVGDMISDVLAGLNARCRGSILVRTGKGLSAAESRHVADYQVADDLLAAVEFILAGPSAPAPEGTGDPLAATIQGPRGPNP